MIVACSLESGDAPLWSLRGSSSAAFRAKIFTVASDRTLTFFFPVGRSLCVGNAEEQMYVVHKKL